MLAGAEDHLATFAFPGVSQTIVKKNTWGTVSPSASRHSTKSCQIDPSLLIYRGGGVVENTMAEQFTILCVTAEVYQYGGVLWGIPCDGSAASFHPASHRTVPLGLSATLTALCAACMCGRSQPCNGGSMISLHTYNISM